MATGVFPDRSVCGRVDRDGRACRAGRAGDLAGDARPHRSSGPRVLRVDLPDGNDPGRRGAGVGILLAAAEKAGALVALATGKVLSALRAAADGSLRRPLGRGARSARAAVSHHNGGPAARRTMGRRERQRIVRTGRFRAAAGAGTRDRGGTSGVRRQRPDPAGLHRYPSVESLSAPLLVPLRLSAGRDARSICPAAAAAAERRTGKLQPVRPVRGGLSRRGNGRSRQEVRHTECAEYIVAVRRMFWLFQLHIALSERWPSLPFRLALAGRIRARYRPAGQPVAARFPPRRFGRGGRGVGQCRRVGPAPRQSAVPRADGQRRADPSARRA